MFFLQKQHDFYGHFVPGSFFAGFGLFALSLAWVRLRRGTDSADGASFCRTHVPETNVRVLTTLSASLMFCTTAGILMEGINCSMSSIRRSFFCNPVHETLYSLFFLVGFMGLLEAYRLLPPDSIRAGTVLASAGQAFLWEMHAQSKTVPVESLIHFILALISFVTAVVMLASIYLPHRLELYLGGYAGILLQGIWLLSASLLLQREHMVNEIGVCFVLEVAGMALVMVLGTAYLRWIKKNNGVGDSSCDEAILDGGAYDKIDPTQCTSSCDEEAFGILDEGRAHRVDLRLEEIS